MFWIVVNLDVDRIIVTGERYVHVIEWVGHKYVEHLAKITYTRVLELISYISRNGII